MTLCRAKKLEFKLSTWIIEKIVINCDEPSGLLRNLNAQQSFTSFTKLSTFSDETQSVEVHVSTRNDRYESFVRTDELIVDDVSFQTSQCESSGRFSYRSRFCSSTLVP